MEVPDALQARNVILLSLARNYPDYSLPWVIANTLLTSTIGGKQALPIVVAGETIRPPMTGLVAAAQYPFDDALLNGIQPVFIIDEIPLASKSRMKFGGCPAFC
jgi:hypothetical protein